MKYFTPELWASWADPDYTPPPPERDPFRLYRAELETLRHRLEPSAFEFFADADVHDGELLDFQVIDGSRPAPLVEPARRWAYRHDYPVRASLRVLDSADKLVWTLTYSHVRRLSLSLFLASLPLGRGVALGTGGYHELSDAGHGFLRHEILFASDSTLPVEFKTVEVRAELARRPSES
jgi:hypothetical protein